MTTSVVFDDIDYSEIEYDENATDGLTLTDPSASIIALQRLRFLKTRETGNKIVTPETTGRAEIKMPNFNEINYEEYKMRRKAEILKYKEYIPINKKIKFSNLASSRRRQISNISKASTSCENDVIRVKKASNSGIKGDNSLLFLNSNVPYITKL
tara:strand:- start:9139 stop:9603 length:465 start_codon:yes stop_codon:yes gene_type:complete